ncbi:HAD-IA family hydrolase [Acidithiobacillus montserratensis]|uniref:HAD-IA family hydrolase n=1 Tax=Acidithiobacillus montserratensis TaxID=2729135 RepID=A0ACD5HCF8_9PROT|nr:HAD-IA family hydrolase [Acidithiobacillus montserratensis]MBN2678632.1 HAD-IA family hydrolase [Acidithiobacillaceae bacterium]MBU2747809.1 HAD-IA family hydrolase [Acidithiobacillus montserratensis]
MMPILQNRRLIIFDWDGTLMDSISTICRCLAHAFAYAGLEDRGEAQYKEIIGLGLNDALAVLAPEADENLRERILEGYRHCFFGTPAAAMPLFPGVEETLSGLADAGYQLAVATGKARRGLDKVLTENPRLAALVSASRCADETRSKPDPLMLEELLDHYQLPPEAAVMVGDTVHDMEMAVAAGVLPIGVLCGVHDGSRLTQAGAQVCIPDPRFLLGKMD